MFFSELKNCGKREPISRAPPVQLDFNSEDEPLENEDKYNSKDKTVVLQAFNFLIIISGSQAIFYSLVVILIVWIIIGVIYNAPVNWQVVMEDGQSIQCYLWDTLLMRQQLLESVSHLHYCAESRSRLATYRRLLENPVIVSDFESKRKDLRDISEKSNSKQYDVYHIVESESSLANVELPGESWFDKTSKLISKIIGSLPSIILYWIGSIVWVGCGALTIYAGNSPPYTGDTEGSNPKYSKWSNNWQLYINTAVAVVILVTSVFLQNVRTRHENYIDKAMELSVELDKKIELALRRANDNDSQENMLITSEREKRGKIEKCIDYYADVIGSGIGALITTTVFAAWIGIGTIMHWSSNWWLIIGTYTGLVGFFDGFILREVYYRITENEEKHYKVILNEYQSLVQYLGLPHISLPPDPYSEQKNTYSYYSFHISKWINKISSTKYSVLVSLFIIIGLVIASSVMKWSTTGQLIANTPTMIIEGFFLIILIQAHNQCDYRRRLEYKCLYDMKCSILQFIEHNISLG